MTDAPETTTQPTMTAVAEAPTAAIYAYPYRKAGGNTPLFVQGFGPGGLARHPDLGRERERMKDGYTPAWLGPFTLDDGRNIKIRPAACGAGCICAAEYKVVK